MERVAISAAQRVLTQQEPCIFANCAAACRLVSAGDAMEAEYNFVATVIDSLDTSSVITSHDATKLKTLLQRFPVLKFFLVQRLLANVEVSSSVFRTLVILLVRASDVNQASDAELLSLLVQSRPTALEAIVGDAEAAVKESGTDLDLDGVEAILIATKVCLGLALVGSGNTSSHYARVAAVLKATLVRFQTTRTYASAANTLSALARTALRAFPRCESVRKLFPQDVLRGFGLCHDRRGRKRSNAKCTALQSRSSDIIASMQSCILERAATALRQCGVLTQSELDEHQQAARTEVLRSTVRCAAPKLFSVRVSIRHSFAGLVICSALRQCHFSVANVDYQALVRTYKLYPLMTGYAKRLQSCVEFLVGLCTMRNVQPRESAVAVPGNRAGASLWEFMSNTLAVSAEHCLLRTAVASNLGPSVPESQVACVDVGTAFGVMIAFISKVCHMFDQLDGNSPAQFTRNVLRETASAIAVWRRVCDLNSANWKVNRKFIVMYWGAPTDCWSFPKGKIPTCSDQSIQWTWQFCELGSTLALSGAEEIHSAILVCHGGCVGGRVLHVLTETITLILMLIVEGRSTISIRKGESTRSAHPRR